MVTMACDMPLYMALGDGLTICIRVCASQRKACRIQDAHAAGAHLE